ncbi:MAG: hypothetical protein A3D35_02100 [Candidatus Staskawiczbacteria bacterium RIFCSPHIGHO2_02_FULL_34_9]|uniref:Translational regulator CsrA n=1 Tax=Candidatus Staskawiczbacteria bacterium RIFCSPHIGHO2_02_FULL_34_9 TaxID=1802206 RepID=A0A1G2HX46_9BACT|nr:MAG: hypothetical protein A3D35_02100 [Candidatus Staskawiczbacteria bacterium RIFCSPHIGHO2_02_FULL_34_9]
MLVLSRQRNEKIIIGNDPNINNNIVIKVVDIIGNKVRLGIEAPQSIPIHRKEVWEAIQIQKEEQNRAGQQPVKQQQYIVQPNSLVSRLEDEVLL